ncbi:MAG: hypothetical protein E2O52_07640, partial [Gammaproteobacteria bacterium]
MPRFGAKVRLVLTSRHVACWPIVLQKSLPCLAMIYAVHAVLKLRVAFGLWLIALLFPKATYIHCTRNPVDNCVSIFTNPFNQAHSYSRTLEDLGSYYRLYKELTEHFCSVIPVDVLESR